MAPIPTYHPRSPESTVVHRVFLEHWATYVERAESGGRHVPGYVRRDVDALLICGVPAAGFIRLRCPACNAARLVPFSCKARGLCSSCDGRRMDDTAAHLVDRVLPMTPHRMWVLSFPFALRARLATDSEALTRGLTVFIRAIFTWLRRAACDDGVDPKAIVEPGAVSLIQRFGDGLRLTPHIHSIVTDGVFVIDDLTRPPRFHRTRAPTDADVAQIAGLMEHRVTRTLARLDAQRRTGLDDDASTAPEARVAVALPELPGLGPERVKLSAASAGRRTGGRSPPALCADSGGFNVHAGAFVAAEARKDLERLCRYVARPALPEERLALLDDGRVRLQLKRRWSDGTASLIFEPLDFIRRAVALIPPPQANLTRYHGVVAPGSSLRADVTPARNPGAALRRHAKDNRAQSPHQRHRRDRHRGHADAAGLGAGGADGRSDDVRPLMRDRYLEWAPLMARVFAVDVLQCPHCAEGRLEVVAVITKAAVAQRILHHLGLPHELPRPSPARGPPQSDLDLGLGPGPAEDRDVAYVDSDGVPVIRYDEAR